jgi:hypothetical protein
MRDNLPPGVTVNDLPGNDARTTVCDQTFEDRMFSPMYFNEFLEATQHPITVLMGRRTTWNVTTDGLQRLFCDGRGMDLRDQYYSWLERRIYDWYDETGSGADPDDIRDANINDQLTEVADGES